MKPRNLLLAAGLPLLALAVVALARPDVLRGDQVDMPAATLAAGQARPADWATPVDPALRLYRIAPNLYRSALPDSEDFALTHSSGALDLLHFDTSLTSPFLGTWSEWKQILYYG